MEASASAWQQLKEGKITLSEARQLLLDEQNNIIFEHLDLEVNRRFRRQFTSTLGNNLPPLIPLLLWQNCYYIGSPKNLPQEIIRYIRERVRTDINIVEISEKSYEEWSYIQELDIGRINPTKFVDLFKAEVGREELGNLTEMYLLRAADPTEQLNIIIAGAIRNSVSDIHLEPNQHGLRIRYRIDGILRDIVRPRSGISRRLITALKVKSDMNIADSRVPQDGRVRMGYEVAGEQQSSLRLDMRVSTFPGVDGEKAVIRLLPEKNPFSSVHHLGFTKRALPIYEGWLREPHGMIIITGPTGSGKTSTLYTSLQAVKTEDKNVITIEDPVEYTLAGITQGQVSERSGMTFAAGMRAILRQDPDIVMVGEIRDEETAETAVRAALTGHLVFTTVHTNDAVSVIPRLRGLNLDPSLVSDALLGIVAQRLVRKVCQNCAQVYEPRDEDLDYLRVSPDQVKSENWRVGRGCSKCFNSGYSGREALVELLNVDSIVQRFIREDQMTALHDYLCQIDYDSFRVAAIEKITHGITTVEEVRRVLTSSAMRQYSPELVSLSAKA